MQETYECPECCVEVSVAPEVEQFKCPECGNHYRIDRDAEFVQGMWHNLTTLTRILY